MHRETKINLKISEEKVKEVHDEAAACRDALMLQFVHFESAAKKISQCKSHPIFCKNVLIAAQQFLRKNMFTLQLLPKYADIINARKHPSCGEESKAIETTVRESKLPDDEPIVVNTVALQEKLDALLEQQEQLKLFLNQSIKDGKPEEAAMLQRAIGECKEEIRRVHSVLHR